MSSISDGMEVLMIPVQIMRLLAEQLTPEQARVAQAEMRKRANNEAVEALEAEIAEVNEAFAARQIRAAERDKVRDPLQAQLRDARAKAGMWNSAINMLDEIHSSSE